MNQPTIVIENNEIIGFNKQAQIKAILENKEYQRHTKQYILTTIKSNQINEMLFQLQGNTETFHSGN